MSARCRAWWTLLLDRFGPKVRSVPIKRVAPPPDADVPGYRFTARDDAEAATYLLSVGSRDERSFPAGTEL